MEEQRIDRILGPPLARRDTDAIYTIKLYEMRVNTNSNTNSNMSINTKG